MEEMSFYRFLRKLYERLFPLRQCYEKDLAYFNGKSTILDVGCGCGLFIESSPDRIIGLDQNADIVDYCTRKGLRCIEGSCLALPLEDLSINGVYCSHLIEHLNWEDARCLVEEIDRVLVQEGIVVVKTLLPCAYFYDDPSHIKPYSPSAVLSLFGVEKKMQPTVTLDIGEYSFVDIRWDRDLLYRPLVPPSVAPKRFWGRLLLQGVSALLANLGIRTLRRTAYTLVLKKK